jgi:hypothetical protein
LKTKMMLFRKLFTQQFFTAAPQQPSLLRGLSHQSFFTQNKL